ncbi:MAG: hypothetical protein IJT37_00580 [Lachnospiraceae bacterium]|nr:hypothetical protein [Lachnospiraceae bacterium]
MVIIEIYAVQWEKHIELKTDREIKASELCRCIAKIMGEKEGNGFLISCRGQGSIPENARLSGYGIRSGDMLLYIS